ncbi:hypothetical protein [Vibrio sp. SCSIO 43136]|uniref:hypothetical protein n=1 Tax=Vibrio sp. SCSIO 43136 TaxID=2819101 RepID=UPI0020754546|nr:hypothetical protein [Vibrio sp. SCSIO 43136]USD67118.1 hypothetical protein J4N39_21010 [Vibrio sp. SCSIO 43136]
MDTSSSLNDEYLDYDFFKEKKLENSTTIFLWSATPKRELYNWIIEVVLVILFTVLTILSFLNEPFLVPLFFSAGVLLVSYWHNTIAKPMTYEYELSNKGIRFKEICNVSEGYYRVLRGGGAVGILVCIAAFLVIGPLAFVGAGAYALYAPKMATVQRIVNHKCFVLPSRCRLKYYRKHMKLVTDPTDDFPLNGRPGYWYSALDNTYIEPRKLYQLITHLRILGILVDVKEVHSNKELWK